MPPPPLFKVAKSIRLSGIASRFLITSILTQRDLSQLEGLDLNNLNAFAEVDDIPQSLPLKLKTECHGRRIIGRPGPMVSHLVPCVGKLRRLRTLTVGTVGQNGLEEGLLGQWDTWDEMAEEDRYQELATLIRSVSETLEHFRFQQGITGVRDVDGWRRGSTPGGPLLPPDAGTRPSKWEYHSFHILLSRVSVLPETRTRTTSE